MIDIIIACIIGWFIALLTVLTIHGIVETVRGVIKIFVRTYYMMVDFTNKDVLWR